jgi:hypothetical protein
MLFCIAALGSTWGAYAAWFERLVGGSDRAEMMGAGSLHNHGEALYDANTARINALTLLRVSVVNTFPFNTEVGGLVSYGPDVLDMWRRAAEHRSLTAYPSFSTVQHGVSRRASSQDIGSGGVRCPANH